ncbi:MAG: hypothetical protein R3C03_14710 [Pirellulaceae bacterium]
MSGTNPKRIQFECPNCLGSVSTVAAKANERIDCPHCGQSLIVPSTTSIGSAFDDLFDAEMGTETPTPKTNVPESPKSEFEFHVPAEEEVAEQLEKEGAIRHEPLGDISVDAEQNDEELDDLLADLTRWTPARPIKKSTPMETRSTTIR